MKLLVAGIGNIFLGDDAFGIEVVQRLRAHELPPGVEVRDFGIRGVDLGYALTSGVDAVILVDAVAWGSPPGTLHSIEPKSSVDDGATHDAPSPHGMDPQHVLRWAAQLGGACQRVVLVGCEPESFGTENDEPGRMGLSVVVEAALPGAVELVLCWARQLMREQGDDDASTQGPSASLSQPAEPHRTDAARRGNRARGDHGDRQRQRRLQVP